MSPPHSAAHIAAVLGLPPPTPEQTAVIEAPGSPVLVVAGAGSGKTETMAARVVWLVVNGLVRPEEVLGLTFTRKAAIELADRVARRLALARARGLWPSGGQDGPGAVVAADVVDGDVVDDGVGDGVGDDLAAPTVSTYHAYAGRLVSEHGLRLGIEPDARLLTEAAAWQLAHRVVHAYDGDMSLVDYAPSTVVDAVLALSGELSEHLVDPADSRAALLRLADRVGALPGRDHRKPRAVGSRLAAQLRGRARLHDLVERYREATAAAGALDFAGQMALAARLAQQVPAVGAAERQRFRAVLLDEFQDTSEAQLVLLRSLFAGQGLAVTAVGDPHQSIYGWRGASAGTLSRFPEEFATPAGPAPVLPLSTSWRNSVRVLTAANRVAAPLRAATRVPVAALRSRPDADVGTITLARPLTHLAEADEVADWVAGHWRAPDGSPSGVSAAVLCRNRAQFDAHVRALRARDLPVEVVGLGGLLDAPEVLDVVALLTVARDPARGDALMRLLTGPVCRLGAADVDGLWTWARSLADHADAVTDPMLSDALATPPPPGWRSSSGRGVGPVALDRVRALGHALVRVRELAGLPLPELLAEAERLIGVDVEVLSDPDTHPAWGRAQLDALAEVAAGYAASADRPTLGGFVDWLEAARARERGLEPAEVAVSGDAVQVLTVHAAKGLEWDVVAVPGLAEGIFPARSVSSRCGEDGRWRVPEPRDGGWLSQPGGLPYPLRGDRDALPALPLESVQDTDELAAAEEDFRAACGAHSLAEERRLAYVALTRARHHLLLTTPVWSTGSTPRVTSRFLEEVLTDPRVGAELAVWEPMPDPDDPADCVNPLLEQDSTAAWPRPGDERRRALVELGQVVLEAQRLGDPGAAAAADGGSPEEPPDPWSRWVDRLLAERAAAAARRQDGAEVEVPAHLSASDLVRMADDPEAYRAHLRRPLPRPPAQEARTGSRFHAWVEQHYAAAPLVELEVAAGETGPGAGPLEQHFLASPWASRTPYAVEVPVETVVAGTSLRGRIDAVFTQDDGFVVVDWKTGSPPPPADRERAALQLAAYRLAWSRLAGVAPERVRAAFFYASTGETVYPELPDEQGLAARVSALAGRPQEASG